jgi:hypothetical protein
MLGSLRINTMGDVPDDVADKVQPDGLEVQVEFDAE